MDPFVNEGAGKENCTYPNPGYIYIIYKLYEEPECAFSKSPTI
jgi:hypothetical protein